MLSDHNLRAVYNKQGKNKAVEGAGGEMPDPGQMFSQLFGGAAFLWVLWFVFRRTRSLWRAVE